MEEFLKRLKTFKVSTWMLKPKELSPVECARRGFINREKDMILCTHCGAVFTSNAFGRTDILELHLQYCGLCEPLRIDYRGLEQFSVQAFRNRENGLGLLDVLPRIVFPDGCKSDLLFPAFPKIHLKTVYALFGWTAGFKRVHCEMCGIVVECNRNEFALVKTRNWYNACYRSDSEKVSLRGGVKIESGKSLSPIEAHRYYCPWINDITVEDFSYFTTTPTSENVGWRLLLTSLSLEPSN
jgi:hypothetical protein